MQKNNPTKGKALIDRVEEICQNRRLIDIVHKTTNCYFEKKSVLFVYKYQVKGS